ncbi:MAG: uroporphyrinogen decarboxylase family protein [Syntrophorhabdales bacterium]|jgi:uroporphyrinogen-III decarboxylase
MKSTRELYEERLNRIKAAVELRKPDRVPVVPLADSFCARYTGMKMSEFAVHVEKAHQAMFQTFTTIGEVDGVQHATYSVYMLSLLWLSKIKIPGRELPDNDLWQVDELELVTTDDYDTIIEKGWNYFTGEFFRDKLDNHLEKVGPVLAYFPQAAKNFEDAGIVPFSPGIVTIPYECLCGGRTMRKFTRDLFKIPDKVQAVMDAAMPDITENARQVLRLLKPVAFWVGGWRGASEFLSPKLWQRFVWPYFKRLVEVVLEEGVIPVFHLDSNWERDLEFFREFPRGRCVFSPDGFTDIRKIKEVLGDRMCIMGDVPAALLTLGTPDEVYDYAVGLIRDIGPSGFILAQGCDIPPNAKPENVKAMISAATGK